MSIVYLTNVRVVNPNPSSVLAPLELEVSLESLENLEEDLEWKLIYVGDAEDKSKDQKLDCIALGPVQRGRLQFIFVADAPDFSVIDRDNILGMTVMLLSGEYKQQEFVRVGWYIDNRIKSDFFFLSEDEIDALPLPELLSKTERNILADNPRVTRFNIEWHSPLPAPDAAAPADGAQGCQPLAAPLAGGGGTTDAMTDDGPPPPHEVPDGPSEAQTPLQPPGLREMATAA